MPYEGEHLCGKYEGEYTCALTYEGEHTMGYASFDFYEGEHAGVRPGADDTSAIEILVFSL